MTKKINKKKSTGIHPIISLGAVIYCFYKLITYFFFPTYVGFKCNYELANFGPNSVIIIKQFNGDPCMKDGKNRFKTYFRKEFSKKSECINYVKYSKEIDVPSGYIVDCDKKKFELF